MYGRTEYRGVSYDIALIGTGSPDKASLGKGAAMAYDHGNAYRGIETCRLVACADLVREHAAEFAAEFDIPDEHVYEDYLTMLREVEPDMVSVATPVPTHDDIVVDVAETGIVDAIHCEKPMSDTFGGCRRMHRTCEEHDIQLTFNHQRRFDRRWQKARELLESGEIGGLKRVEMSAKNIFDWGTHLVDLANSFNGERDAKWALAGLDYREENVRYGSHNENQALVLWLWENDVYAFASTGRGAGTDLVGCKHRLLGTEGVIEAVGEAADVRVRRTGEDTWEEIDLDTETTERVGDTEAIPRGIRHAVEHIGTDTPPENCSANALRTMEMIFGAYESVRSRSRVAFPLDIDDNPLEAMVESGDLRPEPAGARDD